MPALNGVDLSQFQRHPQWAVINEQPWNFVSVRASEGSTLTDDLWPIHGANLNLSRHDKIIYHLQRTSNPATQFDLLRRQVESVAFNVDQRTAFMIDIEGSNFPTMAQVLNLRDLICSHWNKPNAFLYVGAFTSATNLGLTREMPWWLPWPTGPNGPIPSWARDAVVIHQWGTAGPGEVAGFPNDNIDVNAVLDLTRYQATFDNNQGDNELTPDEARKLDDIWRACSNASPSGNDSIAVRTLNALEHLQELRHVIVYDTDTSGDASIAKRTADTLDALTRVEACLGQLPTADASTEVLVTALDSFAGTLTALADGLRRP